MVNTGGATFFFVSHKESVLNRRSLKETLPLIFFFVYKKKRHLLTAKTAKEGSIMKWG